MKIDDWWMISSKCYMDGGNHWAQNQVYKIIIKNH